MPSSATPAAAFVREIDYTGFEPVPCVLSDGLKRAMLGNDKTRVGWFRDVRCVPPDWPVKPVSGQIVNMKNVPGDFWQIEFINPVTGKTISKNRLTVRDQQLQIVLPEFQDSIAVRLKRLEP